MSDLRSMVKPNDPPLSGQLPPDYQPPKTELWSIPKIVTNTYAGEVKPDKDDSLRLRQGVITEVKISHKTFLIQNVNTNEDDVIEFSFHGDKDSIWSYLVPGAYIRVSRGIFLLNRTHKDVLYLAVTEVKDN